MKTINGSWEDKDLAPNLSFQRFKEMSEILTDLLDQKRVIKTPKEKALLEHAKIIVSYFLDYNSSQEDSWEKFYKTSLAVLENLGFSPEQVVAINVFFRKRKETLEEIKSRIEEKLKGVNIGVNP